SLEKNAARHTIGLAPAAHFEDEFPAARHVEHEPLREITPVVRRLHRRLVVHAVTMLGHVCIHPHALRGVLAVFGANREIHREMLTDGDLFGLRPISEDVAFGIDFGCALEVGAGLRRRRRDCQDCDPDGATFNPPTLPSGTAAYVIRAGRVPDAGGSPDTLLAHATLSR